MAKWFSGIMALCWVLATGAAGAPVTAKQAASAVRGWLGFDQAPLQAIMGQQVERTETFYDAAATALYHVVYLNPAGFVIVAADDLIEPIIGFVPGGRFDPSPDNPLGALVSKDLPDRIAVVKGMKVAKAGGAQMAANNKWKLLTSAELVAAKMTSVSDVRVAPLTTTAWSQSTVSGNACYNYYTPPGLDGNASNYYSGCVATAMAQLMKFWQWPDTGVGTTSFTIKVTDVPESRSLRGGNGTGGVYDWANMANSPSTSDERRAVGALCADAGVAVKMQYSSSASGAYVADVRAAFIDTFKYTNAVYGYNSNNQLGTGLTAMVNPNLDAGCPVLLGIRGTIDGHAVGHAVVCDGYGYNSSTLYHHLNLGWANTDTAWYSLPTIDTSQGTFSVVDECVYNVWKTGSGEIISGRVTNAGAAIPGVAMTATRTGGGGTFTATTNANGIYAFAGINASSQYLVSASKSGYGFANQTASTGLSSHGAATSGNCWAVDFTPTDNPTQFAGLPVGAYRIDLSWVKNPANNNVMVAWNTTNTFGTPAGTYTAGGTISGGGTVLYNGNATSFSHTERTAATTYYYKAWSVPSVSTYTSGVTCSAATGGATPPTVTINKAAAQTDPTNALSINFTVVFSEEVTGFATGDVTITGTALFGTKAATVTGGPTTYNVAVTGMTSGGTVIAAIAAGVAHDAASDDNAASTSTNNTVTYDNTPPTVTINQKSPGQADPTNASPINFTVVFSESVADFAAGDVTITGTAGATTATVTGTGTTYNVAVTGMTGSGTVIVSLAAGVAHDAAGNGNIVSTSTDNTVTYDSTPPTVTINQAAGQTDPTNDTSINFTVLFSEPVSDFTAGDVTITGTAPGTKVATVSGGPTTYNVAVSGMTGNGTVIADIAAGVAHDAVGNGNTASTSSDNTVAFQVVAGAEFLVQDFENGGSMPADWTQSYVSNTVDWTCLAGSIEGNPASAHGGSYNAYLFSAEYGSTTKLVTPAIDFGSPPPPNATLTFWHYMQVWPNDQDELRVYYRTTLTGEWVILATYTNSIDVWTQQTIILPNLSSTYYLAFEGIANYGYGVCIDDVRVVGTSGSDTTPPTVTINQAEGQTDPTNTSSINFTVVFSEAVTDFGAGDVTISGTALFGTKMATVTGTGTTYNVAVSGMMSGGTVIATLAADVAHDAAGNANVASNSMDNTVTYDLTPPTVKIEQAVLQTDPSNNTLINFTVVFSEQVTGFATGDVTITGTAGATIAAVTGSGTTYNVEVSGMSGSGTVIATIPAGVAYDLVGNPNTASTSIDNSVTYDNIQPGVTINQAVGQADLTNASPINFTVVFSEPVTDFAADDVTIGGTSTGTKTTTVTGTGTTYNVAVSGMTSTSSGTVIATLAAGVAHDKATNASVASTSTDNIVTYDIIPPTVTINQAAGQADPTNGTPINFTVLFSEPVSDFATGDVTISGTAGATTATVTGTGTTYSVAVTGMTGSGTVIATLAAGVAQDAATNASIVSTSTDNMVTYDIIHPTVTINQAEGQTDPTNTLPINFTVVFSEPVTNFVTGDVTISGTAGATTATVTGNGTTYNVAVTGMSSGGTVIATLAAGVAQDAATNESIAATSTDNTVTYDIIQPTVTINRAAGQADPTNVSPINFTVVFSEPVADFATGDVTITGTAGATTAMVTGSGTIYNVEVSGMIGSGSVIATLATGVAHDAAGNANTTATSTVTYDVTPPTVTINQVAGQADPTNGTPINFTVLFSEPVSDFATGDVTITGTAGAPTATVTGTGTTYNVAVTGMTGSGTVIATLAAGVAHDAATNASIASTSTDNTVTYDITPPTVTINQAAGQTDQTNTSPINFTVLFSETVSDFATGDVTITGTAGATTATVTATSGTTYNVAVTGMTGSGTVIATLADGVAHDAATNASIASTSTDNMVTYDIIHPTVTINQKSGQADPTNTSPINFTVVFSETVSDFATGDVTITGTANGTKVGTVTGGPATYNVEVSGMTGSGTVIVALAAGVAHDAATNASIAAAYTDRMVTYDITPPTVTINQAAGQADPTNGTPINFTVVFSETVSDFATGDVTITGTAGAPTATVTGIGTTYNVAVTGMTGSGTVIATLAAGVAHDAATNASIASTSTDNTVTYDIISPTVTINQKSGQADPTNGTPINFTVVFSESVADFATGDVTITGTAPGIKTATVTGGPTTYNVAVSGMTSGGTVTAALAAGVAHDAATNASIASTSTDNTVTYAPTGLLSWRQQYFGRSSNDGDAADMADPNKNGIVNLMEYALGGDPAGNTTGLSILPKTAWSASGHLRLSLIRTLDRTDIILVVQGSSSMTGTWTDLARSTGGAPFTELIGGVTVLESGTGPTRSVTIDDLYAADPAHPSRFMRLRVTNP